MLRNAVHSGDFPVSARFTRLPWSTCRTNITGGMHAGSAAFGHQGYRYDLNAMMPIMILFDDAREELDERLRA